MSSGPSVRVERSQGRISRPFIVFSAGEIGRDDLEALVETDLRQVGWRRCDEVQESLFSSACPELRFVHYPDHPTVAQVKLGIAAARTAMTVWAILRNQPTPSFKDEDPVPVRTPRTPPASGECNGELFPVI